MPTKKEPPDTSDLSALSVQELLDEGNRLAAERLAILKRQRALTAELDLRAVAAEDRRRKEAALLGQTTRPASQSVFGNGGGRG